MRVVSVLPSATEIVATLGAEELLVGRSEECDFPPSVRSLPVVMRARTLDSERPSSEIDARVRNAVASSEGLYELDVPLLARLAPDLILTQDLCRVCSVTDQEVVDACARAGVHPRILSVAPTRAEEVWTSIEIIGEAVGRSNRARELAGALRDRTTRVGGHREDRVAVIEWLDPPFESGLWTPDLIDSAGGRPWSAVAGRTALRKDWRSLEKDPPELMILSPCSFSVGRSRRELDGTPLGDQLHALRVAKGIWIADEAYFSRPGPRLAEGVELIRSLLQDRRPTGSMPVEVWAEPFPSEAAR
jgi:iron complex transport system substrate-binding protein